MAIVHRRLRLLAVLAAVLSLAGAAGAAPVFTTIYSFGPAPDGKSPASRLLLGASGVLYGTTQSGGAGYGTVYQLTPPAIVGGAWSETILYSFAGGTDADYPGSGLVADAAGHLFGTSTYGGQYGYGTVYELTPPASGGTAWTETVLYSFSGAADGSEPVAGLALDASGNLFGTTLSGGAYANGTGGVAFELSPPALGGGAWTEAVLHSFGNGLDGAQPHGRLVATLAGGYYGTTANGGSAGYGAAFWLVPPLANQTGWKEFLLYDFRRGPQGITPLAGMTMYRDSALDGVADYGGAAGYGTVYRLTPPASGLGPWTLTLRHSFAGNLDGCHPYAPVLDVTNLQYGTTANCGGSQSGGIVYQLAPPAAGQTLPQETVVHSFTGIGGDGFLPVADLIAAPGNVLYGTTSLGGAYGNGTVFMVR